LKERGVLEIKWIPLHEDYRDLFTKNLSQVLFEKRSERFRGENDAEEEITLGDVPWFGVINGTQGIKLEKVKTCHVRLKNKLGNRQTRILKVTNIRITI
jgi:hypothetical protein